MRLAVQLGNIIPEEDPEEGSQGRGAGAYDRHVTFGDAGHENIECLPGFVNPGSFSADEEDCTGYARANYTVRRR
jgi:hypothetical protein